MKEESAYILVEIMLVSLLFSLVVFLLAMMNLTAVELWDFNRNRVNLQREAVITMEMMVDIINQASAVKDITENEMTVLTADGDWEKIYYKEGQGLCWAANNNVLSRKVVSVKFDKESESFLIINLELKSHGKLKKLITGVEL
ncbi:hypothetical protein [Halanaerobacter jeridensis]|uniref:Competence protein ComGC n=1 Tax=Halanaerobacter jeridensis TaxID=706427 RepID=A0A939BNG5_9FIRM|nr:hypothetical protein [Halanaerobacter jeridensis]MBM7555203.1 competence protein ComGC [Halanaerobacter jeridensis]